jgi:hypothetical protein
MDISDLYDHEIAKVGKIWRQLMAEFSHRANTRANLDELARRAHDEFLKVGLVIELNTAPCLIWNPRTGSTGSPEIVVLGRVPGSEYTEQGVGLFDHELKRHEVLTARDRGEDFMGQKEKPSR